MKKIIILELSLVITCLEKRGVTMQVTETSRPPLEGFSFDDDIAIELDMGSNNFPDDLTHAHSTLSEDEISELTSKYHLPTKGFWYVTPSSLRAHQSPPGGLAIYETFLEAGCRFPLEENLAEIFRLVGLCPSQLVPNGWRSLVSFIICCRGKGVAPKAELFLKLFRLVCSDKSELRYSFMAYPGYKFLVDNPFP